MTELTSSLIYFSTQKVQTSWEELHFQVYPLPLYFQVEPKWSRVVVHKLHLAERKK